ncbi:DMT family transporter [Pollutimonas harenae]|uniref:DMT family transporter n=1 Tax=Pollutimonas harenae TaxID=657015 RepID=A0A853H9Z5_9BURK|nr:DMT family transporter [Pollutimonas harenae]NYT86844.1 DMT family transporter [Pollutimonas harenae]TEA69438.1 DMT family transporter [Pollutimonas harenae]
MYTLIISIACSVAVSVLLKIARQQRIEIDQAIAVNYAVAASLCLLILQPEPATLLNPSTPWWVLITLGVLLPAIFLAMAGAVRHAGIVLSDAAQRLSLFLPLIAAFLLFGEDLSGSKLAGIALALTALICLLLRPRAQDGSGDTARTVFYLLAVWLGYGTIDILFKQLAKSGAVFSSSLLAAFTLAGILILAYLIIRRSIWHRRNVVAGVVLGLLNFSNIYFYIRAHQVFPQNPTLVFSAMNIGVISLGTLVGAGFFKEKLSLVNVLGIALAIGAIVILIPR